MISFGMRCAIRKAKHRSEFRATYDQWDQGKRRIVYMGVTPDPMLDLFVARQNHLRYPSPLNSQRYGEIRQTVVSPVVTLP